MCLLIHRVYLLQCIYYSVFTNSAFADSVFTNTVFSTELHEGAHFPGSLYGYNSVFTTVCLLTVCLLRNFMRVLTSLGPSLDTYSVFTTVCLLTVCFTNNVFTTVCLLTVYFTNSVFTTELHEGAHFPGSLYNIVKYDILLLLLLLPEIVKHWRRLGHGCH